MRFSTAAKNVRLICPEDKGKKAAGQRFRGLSLQQSKGRLAVQAPQRADAGWPAGGPTAPPSASLRWARLQARPSSAGRTARRCCPLVPLQLALLAPRGGCGRSALPLPRQRIDRPRRSAASGRLPPLRCGAQRRTRAAGRPPCISLHHRALQRFHMLSLCSRASSNTPRHSSPCGRARAVARVLRRGAQGPEGCAAQRRPANPV